MRRHPLLIDEEPVGAVPIRDQPPAAGCALKLTVIARHDWRGEADGIACQLPQSDRPFAAEEKLFADAIRARGDDQARGEGVDNGGARARYARDRAHDRATEGTGKLLSQLRRAHLQRTAAPALGNRHRNAPARTNHPRARNETRENRLKFTPGGESVNCYPAPPRPSPVAAGPEATARPAGTGSEPASAGRTWCRSRSRSTARSVPRPGCTSRTRR